MDKEVASLILDALKELNTELKAQGKTLSAHNEILKEHTRRSEANEKILEIVREEYKPIQKHVVFVETALKLAGAIAGLAGFIYIVLQIIKGV